MSSGESDLRRKHIATLEVLQKLSDENEALKAQMGGGCGDFNGGGGDEENLQETNDKILKLLNEKTQLLRSAEDSLAAERANAQEEMKQIREENDQLKAGNRESKRNLRNVMKELETQHILLEDLRRQVEEKPKEVLIEVEKVVEKERVVEKIVEKVVEKEIQVADEGLREDHTFLLEEIDRKKLETEALHLEIIRLGTELNELRSGELKSLRLQVVVDEKDKARLVETVKKLEDKLEKNIAEERERSREGRVRPEMQPGGPDATLSGYNKNDPPFKEYVKLKKENAMLKIQLQQLQKSGAHRRSVKF